MAHLCTGNNLGLSMLLMMTAFRRTGHDHGYYHKHSYRIDAGHCLDAPDTMAAGSTIREELDCAGDDWAGVPRIFTREQL